MKASFRKLVVALIALGMVGSVALAGDQLRLRARLRADASAGDISGNAKYREKDDGRRRFQLEVEGFRPGTTLDVVVAGVRVGSVTIDNLGVGELDFDTQQNDPNDDETRPFPDNFPNIGRGDSVRVGQLRGTLQRRN
jgi:hypothetical protein